MQEYYYKWKKLVAKSEYHLKIIEILNDQIDNTTDPDAKKKLWNLRSYHRRMARKYISKSTICWNTAGKE